MNKYRKKPVVIEAIQLTKDSVFTVIGFIGHRDIIIASYGITLIDACFIDIKTLEGMTTASEGDWVIKGVKGEFYACKPDIFEMTYEKVEL